MGNISHFNKLNRHVLSTILVTFPLATIPMPAFAVNNGGGINLNDVAFMVRVEKLIEKINRYKERSDSEKLIDSMMDLKFEVEGIIANICTLFIVG